MSGGDPPADRPDDDADGPARPDPVPGTDAADADDPDEQTLMTRVSRRFPALLMARRNLSRNRLRSALAALGIIIGVLAIASLGMFGTTLRIGASQNLGDIGNEISVSPNAQAGVRELSERDVSAIRRIADDSPTVAVKQDQRLVERGQTRSIVTVYGMENPGVLYEAESGRVPDRLNRDAVVGSALAERFNLEAGNTITVENSTFRVAAVLEEQGGISLISPNNAIILPPGTFDQRGFDQVVVSSDSGTVANETATEIREELNRREDRVSIFELSSITEGINQFFGILNAFLIGVGSISLIVAAVSILNVMLMSTVERRQEIGVLRAVGVSRGDVVRMILSEAGLLGAVGGVIGAILAVGAGLALNSYVLNDAFVTFRVANLVYIALAFVFALVTSVLSGLYPAWKAANEPPVEALRK
jgi:putative ABC transport system permease protein